MFFCERQEKKKKKIRINLWKKKKQKQNKTKQKNQITKRKKKTNLSEREMRRESKRNGKLLTLRALVGVNEWNQTKRSNGSSFYLMLQASCRERVWGR